ncbi:hypothetical protein [Stenotrophomonas sp. 24(2023)]|uniref:DUF2884 family protein n=1 Tax=Stenotrophomonas sp. 24(2023) TaxID=3068324 RepID=UPI0027E1AFE3|nr:hypothetical protein [Stenotrophomonas sp. 24(2023)]WMJ69743.1 hypothetical protein Q9R17_01125 [Stenotrophomonas sp. 24(2023)]
MNAMRLLLPTALLCLPLVACGGPAGNDQSPGKAVAEATSNVGQTVKEATDKARKEVIQGNISVSADGQPKAAITPDGRFLVDGKEVPADDNQRRLLKAYRGHVEAIALDGMDIGLAGAKLGANAAGEAIKGIFSGDTQGLEARINAQADQIKAHAQRICKRLPALLTSQQALASALPAFKPYATMEQKDVDDCGKDNGKGYTVNF